jgi:hypothetical protein
MKPALEKSRNVDPTDPGNPFNTAKLSAYRGRAQPIIREVVHVNGWDTSTVCEIHNLFRIRTACRM